MVQATEANARRRFGRRVSGGHAKSRAGFDTVGAASIPDFISSSIGRTAVANWYAGSCWLPGRGQRRNLRHFSRAGSSRRTGEQVFALESPSLEVLMSV